jgi:hypothetical protein
MQRKPILIAALAAALLSISLGPSSAAQSVVRLAEADGPMVITPQPDPNRPQGLQPAPAPGDAYGGSQYDPGGPGQPYTPGPGSEPYVPPEAQSQGTFSAEEIKEAGHRFFGKVTVGFARVVEYAFQRAGQPNGYILGEEAGGAFIAGLRYGEGTLYTKDAGERRVYWQGPSVGYDFGAEGSKTMVLVYNLHSPSEIYNDFAGVDGSAYFIGGVGVTFLSGDHVKLAPIRAGVGLRLGANIGYLKYTRQPTWNPF